MEYTILYTEKEPIPTTQVTKGTTDTINASCSDVRVKYYCILLIPSWCVLLITTTFLIIGAQEIFAAERM